MRTIICLILGLWSFNFAGASAADFVVIGNPNSGIEKLSRGEIINIYMGRTRMLPSGLQVHPIDLTTPATEKSVFYSTMIKKEVAEINSYWARLKFSGQGTPPEQIDNVDEILQLVATTKGAIAYVDRKKIDNRVKIIFDPNQ